MRAENYAALKAGLSDIEEIQILQSDGDNVRRGSHYCLAIVLADKLVARRSEIIAAINARGVGTSIYYPVPVPLTKFYKERYASQPKDYPNALRISSQSIALPIGPHLNKSDMKTIVGAVKAAVLENIR